jgi:hypothetical protein
MVAATGGDQALSFNYAPPAETPAPEGEDAGDEEHAPARSVEPLVAHLEAWLAPFRGAARAKVEERFLKLLAQKRQDGPVTDDVWNLSFRLTPPAEAPALARELEEAWFRGEVNPYWVGSILETAAPALKADLPRWLSRWPETSTYERTRTRVAILAKARQQGAALGALLASRGRAPWSAKEEALAFDLWRGLGAAPGVKAPDYWAGAAAVWSGAVPLGDRLKAHPHDVLAARAALRNLNPGDEDALGRAALVLAADRPWGRLGSGRSRAGRSGGAPGAAEIQGRGPGSLPGRRGPHRRAHGAGR